MLLAGLDIGSTGCKITVYSQEGTFLGRIYQDYPVGRSHSEHEVDPKAIWDAVRDIIQKAAKVYPCIGGIGIASFGESFALLDQQDRILFPAMLYTDSRGETEAEELAQKLGRERIIEITGTSPAAMYSLPKLMWIQKNKPDIWACTDKILLMEDYIVYMLTGKRQIDYSLAARTMAFDIQTLCWSDELCEAASVDKTLFSQPVATGTSAGRVKPILCEELGLAPDTLIVSVSHDQVAAAVGSGIFDESCAVDGAGTVECITPVFSSFDATKLAEGKYAVIPYITPGKYVCYAFLFTGGSLIDWCVKSIAGYAKIKADETGKRIYNVLEEEWDGNPTDLLLLPHFAGAATPYMDTGCRGAILGLSLEHTERDIYIACMEAICLELRLNIEKLQSAGVTVDTLRAVGGGAKSNAWMQMKADILNIPITVLASEEAGAAGCAMLVGVACGIFKDIHSAAEILVVPKHTYLPRAAYHSAYENKYQKYLRLYDAVRPLM